MSNYLTVQSVLWNVQRYQGLLRHDEVPRGPQLVQLILGQLLEEGLHGADVLLLKAKDFERRGK